MFLKVEIPAQSSFELNGYQGFSKNTSSMIDSYESNPGNFSLIKDWGLLISYGSEFSPSATNSNLYLVALSKSINSHNLSVRYTPGYQKEFFFNNGQSIILQDSSAQSLSSRFTYKELFGFGYSYKFSDNFSAGFDLRYFTEEFNQETVTPIFSDSLTLKRENLVDNINFWKADLGINYSVNNNISFTLASINLMNFGEMQPSEQNSIYDMRKQKGALIGMTLTPVENLKFNFLYETTRAFQTGFNSLLETSSGNFGFGLTAFHDRFQQPYLAGIIPTISYSTKSFGVALSGVKYFSNRNQEKTLSDFQMNGINNIINNRYSYNKAVLSVTFSLNTITEQKIKILDVNIVKDIYPTFSDLYIDNPFAYGRVVNLTDKPITVKSSCRINSLNIDRIQSKPVTVNSRDTVNVPFYTIIPDSFTKDKTEISYADFYVSTDNNNPDDEFQKPVLIYSVNSWDDVVSHLKYFIEKDLNFSMNYAKNILSEHKGELDTISYALSTFYKAKILFNAIVKNLVYVADPNASSDYVQFPHQTLKIKGGDCDDLSVYYSSILESVGVQTALVDYKPQSGLGHVSILINTELSPSQARLITDNDTKFFVRKNTHGVDEIWIAVETTSLTNFDTSWELGSQKFNTEAISDFGLAKNRVQIIDVE